MGEEQRPSAVFPKRFQTHQRFISLLSPELARSFEAGLILLARRFHGAAAQRLSSLLGSFIVQPVSIVVQVVALGLYCLPAGAPQLLYLIIQ